MHEWTAIGRVGLKYLICIFFIRAFVAYFFSSVLWVKKGGSHEPDCRQGHEWTAIRSRGLCYLIYFFIRALADGSQVRCNLFFVFCGLNKVATLARVFFFELIDI